MALPAVWAPAVEGLCDAGSSLATLRSWRSVTEPTFIYSGQVPPFYLIT